MLKIHPVQRHPDKFSSLENFDPTSMTWLVADLTTKSEIQLRLLQQHGVLPENAVLRASELWSKLFQNLFPSWRLVSHDFMRSQLTEFLKKQNHTFASTPGASKTLMTFIQQLLPVLSDPAGEESLQDWFEENPSALIRWGHWSELARSAWKELEQMGIITGTWCSGLLVSHDDLVNSWDREIIADLGCQINSVEADLLKKLSLQNSVSIFYPENHWTGRYGKTLNAYNLFVDKPSNKSETLPPLPVPETEAGKVLEIERYSTMVTEVKAIVSKVRKDLEKGLAPNDIAVIAPDMELYWSVLHHYLNQEGIPFQKNILARTQTFENVDIWLAQLRLAMGAVTSHDLERASFGDSTKIRSLSFEKFKRLFSIIYDSEDLGRWQEIKSKFESKKTTNDTLFVHEFLVWISSYWPDNENIDPLARLIKKIYTESPLNLPRELGSWMDLLENLAAKDEVNVQEGVPGGIYCLNIQEASWIDVTSRYFIGLSADALRSEEASGLLFGDVQKIHNDLGYILMWPDKAHLEFETLWLLQESSPQTHLSFSATDFSGGILAPSMIWLLTAYKAGRDVEALSLSQPTRWDEIQRAEGKDIANFRLWSEEHAETLESSIQKDLGDLSLKPFGGELPWSLSASQLEKYLECPFKFAAEKIFGLSDQPDLELDIDHMSRGNMMHKLFEWLTEEPFRSNWSDQELAELVDKLPEATRSPLADKRLWPSTRNQYIELARRFLQNENQLREDFPELHTDGRELEISAKWNAEKKQLVPVDQEGILFRGFIDRVDRNQSGQAILVDYKSQDTRQTNYSRWLVNDQLQLGLYSMAFEEGLTELGPSEVIGAFYYSAKTMNREKGFRMEEWPGTLYAENKRSRTHLTSEGKKELFEGLKQKVAQSVDNMQQGLFPAEPKEPKDCPKCPWNKLCRAQHLNS